MSRSLNEGNSSRVGLLQRRVGVLLGLRGHRVASLTRVFTEAGLELLTDSVPGQSMEDSSYSAPEALGTVEDNVQGAFQPVPPAEPGPEAAKGDWGRLFDEIEYLRDGVLSDSILRNGIYLDRYRVSSQDQGEGFPVLFRRDERELWWQIAVYPTREEAIRAVNHLRRFLVRLSVASEGLHIIEHILLRPLSPSYSGVLGGRETLRQFCSFKLSVFFPSWTARCSDAGFRRLADTTVREACPAHVYPEIHWLDFSRMRLLEDLLEQWTRVRSDAAASSEEIDAASLPLARFIMETDTAHQGSGGGQM